MSTQYTNESKQKRAEIWTQDGIKKFGVLLTDFGKPHMESYDVDTIEKAFVKIQEFMK